MKSNREILIERLQALEILDGRYERIQCANYNEAENQKRGHWSLVFRAYDRLQQKEVALKFFDPHPGVAFDEYRRDAFTREPEILKALLGQRRCLQLVQGLMTFYLDLPIPGDEGKATLPCQYFAVDWIAEDIDDFFERQDQFSAEEKLLLFNEIVLAVQALHDHEVFHRDIKYENMRSYSEALKRIVVAIDLGTAARFDSQTIGSRSRYSAPVGDLRYSAPETSCGLSGHRDVAPSTDVYALGCLLYELFNKELFAVQIHRDKNRIYAMAALSMELAGHETPNAKLAAWKSAMRALRPSISSPAIATPGHSVPAAIQPILNRLLCDLTAFDFRDRILDLETVRQRIWAALRVLRNRQSESRALADKRLYRKRREEKIRRREQRLEAYLKASRELLC